ncbi:hypothetical protein EPA93_23630 [Ktedonosporobacter rubrisoli]|uniref:ATPase BadF/BadG/BcrA/BcrD type domain-containing protein n=1 Tax=Ktedonosporobacter rubrisoli TaxID=2509675 RepID=A0A4P6JU47_KTERU|nr:BadF/BadG/BcrA/BcrD ATPase family protein [Ktedonosporobacter rubrisoli]QBD78812.1 hypothetical protein EPA93_23630 [Ktedonosporobacter rubrisoli]
MHYVLGVDGGNTKTIALVAALDGTILGAGRGGCGDIYRAPLSAEHSDTISAALANIEYAVTRALRAARIERTELASAMFSMAGVDWPEDAEVLREAMQQRGFGRKILVQNDALSVVQAGFLHEPAVSLICGTGAATGARNPDGRSWCSCNWQDQIQGGGQLGQKTLDAIYRAALGIEPPTSLTPRVLEAFQMQTVEEVLHCCTGRNRKPPISIHRLAPILLSEAEAGDAVARRIVLEHGHALGDYALAAARHVGIEGTAFALVFAGGVFRHPTTILLDAIVERVRSTSPDVRPERSRFEPAIGVLLAALQASDVAINDEVIEKLIATLPDTSLFATV